MPPGGNAEARRFYTGVLGMCEIPSPSTMPQNRLVWFSVSDDVDELHLLVDEEFQPVVNGQHLCLVVHDLAALRQVLEDAGVKTCEEPYIPFRPRFSFRSVR